MLKIFSCICLATILPPAKGESFIGCPPTHEGKSINNLKVFDGPPENKADLEPERGYFIFDQGRPEQWKKNAAIYLRCEYKNTSDAVIIELPRTIKKCEVFNGPNVKCY